MRESIPRTTRSSRTYQVNKSFNCRQVANNMAEAIPGMVAEVNPELFDISIENNEQVSLGNGELTHLEEGFCTPLVCRDIFFPLSRMRPIMGPKLYIQKGGEGEGAHGRRRPRRSNCGRMKLIFLRHVFFIYISSLIHLK
ncbi:hypothetical protein M432DRAFT_609085 [Thermoascus aurantiacus ATCC 26904]